MEKKIDYNSLVLGGVDYNDAPDFCDAYFTYGQYDDGTEIEDSVLDELSDSDYKYERIYSSGP